ncbi:MAG: LacI family transcriptional regulator [Victivallaceae bacterium]|nr:LacI family transcriptional regulator [Victivallaceae bacterium]
MQSVITKPINQKTVAKLAGVARSAVSMHINNYPGQSEATKKKIKTVIDELGYRPSRIARSLKGNKSLLIGVVYFCDPAASAHDFVIFQLLQGVQKAAFESGYALSFFFQDTHQTAEETLSEAFSKNVEGIVFLEDNLEYSMIKNIKLPKVVINRKIDNVPSVWSDIGDGIYQATKYLISLGHKNIGFIGGRLSKPVFVIRWQGFQQAMIEAGLEINNKIIHHEATDNKDSYVGMRKILKSQQPITGLVCDNDLKAWGALDAIKEYDLRIPEDISVIGFDNMPQSDQVQPALSSIDHPRRDIGYQAGKLLMTMINQRNDGVDIIIPTQLIIRESCAKIKDSTPK